jgi:hypothetical protein
MIRINLASAVAIMLFATLGCQSIGGRTVLVEFQSADGIASGQPVYFAGVQVGATKEPVIVHGRARVPVRLWRRYRDALPDKAVFLFGDDPNQAGARALLGYAAGIVPRRVEDGADLYQGVSCELELAVLIGAEKAKRLMAAMQNSPLLHSFPGR